MGDDGCALELDAPTPDPSPRAAITERKAAVRHLIATARALASSWATDCGERDSSNGGESVDQVAVRAPIFCAYAAFLCLVQLVLQERCTHVSPLELILEERDEALEDHDLSGGVEA